eukprot:6062226-Pyramimonas_sp.AAC.1
MRARARAGWRGACNPLATRQPRDPPAANRPRHPLALDGAREHLRAPEEGGRRGETLASEGGAR